MKLATWLDGLAKEAGSALVGRCTLPARPARFGELSPPPPPELVEALANLGVQQLYSHQVQAIEAVRAGQDVVMVTGTASGKTMGYVVPIAEAVLADPRARAICLYPLKALASDQREKFAQLRLGSRLRVGAYDGDTNRDHRRAARANAQVLLTNPDLLHLGLLPHHGLWADWLANLRYVVLDEVHTYRGVFGSQVASVLWRLLRLCQRYGSRPTFIASSATIANPAQLCEVLTGRTNWLAVDEDGSPTGQRYLAIYQPPLVDTEAGLRRSPADIACRTLRQLAESEVRTLAFTFSRGEAERIVRLVHRAQKHDRADGPKRRIGRKRSARRDGSRHQRLVRIAAYRAGYSAEERRALERDLAEGQLDVLVSTVALEAGIDIGALDAVLTVGFPGSVAQYWQQVGRAGRRGEEALGLLLLRNAAVDQYLALHPELLWSEPVEEARIDPGNPYILSGHLLCAAREMPLTAAELDRMGASARRVMPILVGEGYLEEVDDRWFYLPEVYPAARVNLRTASDERWCLVDPRGRQLEEDDDSALWERYHPGAIHLRQGDQFEVTEVQPEERRILVQPVTVPYYTRPLVRVEAESVSLLDEQANGQVRLGFGEVLVQRRTVGYQRLQESNQRLLETHFLSCPERELETAGLWLGIGPDLQARLDQSSEPKAGAGGTLAPAQLALHGAEHALLATLPLVAMCSPRDVLGSGPLASAPSGLPDGWAGWATCLLYDGFPGGIGLVQRGYEAIDLLWKQALDLVVGCPCQTGCPGCVQATWCGRPELPVDKAGALAILQAGYAEQAP